MRRTIELAGGGPVTLFCRCAIRRISCLGFALQMSHGAEVEFKAPICRSRSGPDRLDRSGPAAERHSGVARVVVWRYEDYAALRPRFLARLLPPALAAGIPDPPPANESVTQAGYEWFVAAR